mgnify:CR=1 FL=1
MESFIEVNLKCARCLEDDQFLSTEDKWVEAVNLGKWDTYYYKVLFVSGELRGKEASVPVKDCRRAIPVLLKAIKEEIASIRHTISQHADRLREKTTVPVDDLLALLDQVKEAGEKVTD